MGSQQETREESSVKTDLYLQHCEIMWSL